MERGHSANYGQKVAPEEVKANFQTQPQGGALAASGTPSAAKIHFQSLLNINGSVILPKTLAQTPRQCRNPVGLCVGSTLIEQGSGLQKE